MLSLVFLLAIVAGVAWLVRQRDATVVAGGTAVQSLRRLLQYGVLLAALVAVVIGVGQLIVAAFPDHLVDGRRSEVFAGGVALTLVATPVWLLVGRLVARHLRDDLERTSTGWGLYLFAVTTGSLVLAVTSLVDLGDAVMGVSDFRAGPLAFALTGVAVWVLHQRLAALPVAHPAPFWSQAGRLAGSVVGLVMLAVAGGGLARFGLEAVYRALFDASDVLDHGGTVLRHSLILGVVAFPVWWWHWWRRAARGPRDTTWLGVVLLVAILGGLVTAVAAGGVVLATTLDWLLAPAGTGSAADHFVSVPVALAVAAVGLVVWRYHQRVVATAQLPGAPTPPTEPVRAYRYLAAGVGLTAATAGAAVGLATLVDAAVTGTLDTADAGIRGPLVAAVALLVLGIPLWWSFWRQVPGRRGEAPADELRSPSRRAYLFVSFGVLGAAAAVALAIIVFVTLRDLVEGRLTMTVLTDLQVAIGVVLATSAVAAYHRSVYQGDRAHLPPDVPGPVRHREVLLIAPRDEHLGAQVAKRTGARVQVRTRADVPPRLVDPDTVVAALLACDDPSVVVTVEADGTVGVVPVEGQDVGS